MNYSLAKQREWSNELYEKGSEFHGHGGLFMAVGLRMGLLALQRLDARGWFNISCTAHLRWSPPDSCVIDGIQVSTGCTMGKHNIAVKEAEGIASEFESKGCRIVILVRNNVLQTIRECSAGDERFHRTLEYITSAPDENLFEVS